MKWRFTERAAEDFDELPAPVRKAFGKQVLLLAANIQHPSLHAKKYDEARDLWQGRVNRSWRFYFQIEADTITIIRIIPHPK